MSLVISKVFTYDTDAGDYIQAVEAADGQALEPATRQAINNFVIGCKQDGIWSAIKASCILSGARTLNGALQPLVGTAPTNVGGLFVSGDYNRKTGLVGNGSSKYLNSNRALNADPQNSQHLAVFAQAAGTGSGGVYGGASGSGSIPWSPETSIGFFTGGPFLFINNRSGDSTALTVSNQQAATGFIGAVRNDASSFSARVIGSNYTKVAASSTPPSTNQFIFARQRSGAPEGHTNACLAFYSIGESLDLALLDARVTALITAFGVAIP
jgi:hypothetical protein